MTRSAVAHPAFSPWSFLYRNADENSFLYITGMTRAAFEKLKDILFEDEIKGPGHPFLLDNTAMLVFLTRESKRFD